MDPLVEEKKLSVDGDCSQEQDQPPAPSTPEGERFDGVIMPNSTRSRSELPLTQHDNAPSEAENTADQAQLNKHGFCGAERVGLSLGKRIYQFGTDCINRGPAFAFFNFLMTAKEPVDPSTIRTLVGLVPTPAIQLAVRFPSPAKRAEFIRDLSSISLKTGVVGHYDLSNTLSPENTLRVWELLLGKHGFYSAAEFDPAHGQMNLREACLRKVESIRRLLVTSGVCLLYTSDAADEYRHVTSPQ